MNISLNNKEYTLLIGYESIKKRREALNELSKKVFNLSLEAWYDAGYWTDKCIPYTLFDGEIAVCNILVNTIDFTFFGILKNSIQLGTVMTDEDYRGKGLTRFLIEYILKEFSGKVDFVYLYANKSVLNMYPKFGFKKVDEYESFKMIDCRENYYATEKFDISSKENQAIIYKYIKNSKAYTNFAMKDNADLIMFHCLYIFQDNIYYIKDLDVFVVALFKDNLLRIYDIFCLNKVDVNKVINSLVRQDIKEVVLGFTPDENNDFETRKTSIEDQLFIMGRGDEIFDKKRVMFPSLSHA